MKDLDGHVLTHADLTHKELSMLKAFEETINRDNQEKRYVIVYARPREEKTTPILEG